MAAQANQTITIESLIDSFNQIIDNPMMNLINQHRNANTLLARNIVPSLPMTNGRQLDLVRSEQQSDPNSIGPINVNNEMHFRLIHTANSDHATKLTEENVRVTHSPVDPVRGREMEFNRVKNTIEDIVRKYSTIRNINLTVKFRGNHGSKWLEFEENSHFQLLAYMDDSFMVHGLTDQVQSLVNRETSAQELNQMLNDLMNKLNQARGTLDYTITFCHSNCHCHSSGRSRR